MADVAPIAYGPNPRTEASLVVLLDSVDRVIEQAHRSILEDKISNFLTDQSTRYNRMIKVKL